MTRSIHLKGSPQAGLAGATLGFFVGFAAVALFGPTAKMFQDVMQLSPTMIGFLIAMPSLSGSILRIPFSAWVDTTGGRKPFLVLLTLSIVGMLGVFIVVWRLYPDNLTPGYYPLLLVLGFLCGCGIATFSPGIGQVAYWHPQRAQGRALGTYAGVGNLAPGLFSFLLPVALANLGLAGSYLAWLLFLIAGTGLYALMGRNSYYFQYRAAGESIESAKVRARELGQELFPAGSTLTSLRLSAQVWKTWVLVGIYFTTFGGFIALTAWFPTYWRDFHGAAPIMAGVLTASYSILASLMRVAGGRISDALGGEKTALGSLATMLGGAVALTFAGQMPIALAGAILMAIGMGVANAAVFKLVPQEVPKAVGGAAGWVGGLGAFGGFAIPPVMGWCVGQWGEAGFRYGFLVFAVLTILSLALIGLLRTARSRAQAHSMASSTSGN